MERGLRRHCQQIQAFADLLPLSAAAPPRLNLNVPFMYPRSPDALLAGSARRVAAPTGSAMRSLWLWWLVAVMALVPLMQAKADPLAVGGAAGVGTSATAGMCRPQTCFANEAAKRDYAARNNCWFAEDVCEGKRTDQESSAASYGRSFFSGLIDGFLQQAVDLWELIANPLETINGLIEIGKSFYRDPEGTLQAIGEMLGAEVLDTIRRATQCGAYDTGKVIGENVNPVVLLRLGTRLARYGGRLEDAVHATKRDFGCASFAADTLILTPQGALPIKQLQVGQQVLSRDEREFSDGPQAIERVFRRTAPTHRILLTESQQLRVTDEHPLWVQGKGWVAAEQVQIDDVLAARHGDELVRGNDVVPRSLEVHNFSVEKTPNYFVGEVGIWAHNARCDPSVPRTTVEVNVVNGRAPELNDPKPNTTYRVNGGQQVFEVDELGRTTKAEATITEHTLDATLRNCYQQRKAVSVCEGIQGDDGGHMIGHKLGGVGERVNILPQLASVNRGEWNRMEREWGRLAADGKTVKVTVVPIYGSGEARRPIRFEVQYVVDDVVFRKVFNNE
ncbi:DNA/RNA non-specific endonuclease [Aquincola sp. MAHUQ-54]|uniref:DNA/RNA non-specific endonuclease n=1 Tax=Aquincola agrisoli TaxID=3119538 RepID=A0AAW9QJ56_9BURK